MTYCTKETLVERFGVQELEAYAWDDDADAINDARVATACIDASALIDTYVAAVATTPVDPVPELLENVACDIARYRLQERSPLDEARARYEDAIRLLKDIGQGRAVIGGQPQTQAGTDAHVLRTRADRTFTRETLEGF